MIFIIIRERDRPFKAKKADAFYSCIIRKDDDIYFRFYGYPKGELSTLFAMHAFVIIMIILGAVFGPNMWARHVLRKYDGRRDSYPGTGADLARHLLEMSGLRHVRVEMTDRGDHYHPEEKIVGLSPAVYEQKSLTAVVVATHEIGHAIQDQEGYRPLHIRARLIHAAAIAEKIGAGFILAMPFITMITRIPSIGLLTFLSGFAILGVPVIIHLVTVGVEWDASFKRALPILERNLPAEDLPAARRILTACALTYVAASLAGLLNFWRWIRILRR